MVLTNSRDMSGFVTTCSPIRQGDESTGVLSLVPFTEGFRAFHRIPGEHGIGQLNDRRRIEETCANELHGRQDHEEDIRKRR